MPGYYRGYRRYTGYYRPKYTKYTKRRYYRKTYANKRAAAQQKDSLTIVVKYQEARGILMTQGTNDASLAISIIEKIASSPMYGAFASMYDSFKIDGVTVNVSCRNLNANYITAASPLTVVTAWDRTGLEAQYDNVNNQYIVHDPTYTEVCQYGSAFTRQAYYGGSYKTTRSIYPSTMEEKSQYITTAKLSGNLLPGMQNAIGFDDDPRIVRETGCYKFKPILLMGISRSDNVPETSNMMNIDIDYEFTLTFRGLRKIPVQQ